MRGERDEVSKRTKRENTTKNEKIGNKIGIIILTAMLILSPIMMLNWDLRTDDEPIHDMGGRRITSSGSDIFENLNSKKHILKIISQLLVTENTEWYRIVIQHIEKYFSDFHSE